MLMMTALAWMELGVGGNTEGAQALKQTQQTDNGG